MTPTLGVRTSLAALILVLCLDACRSDTPASVEAANSDRPLPSASRRPPSSLPAVASPSPSLNSPAGEDVTENACVVFEGERVGQVAWSPDGTSLVTTSQHSTGTIVRVATWPELSFRQLDVSHGNHLLAVTAGPDGTAYWLRDGFRADDGKSGIAYASAADELSVIDLPSVDQMNDLRELQWTEAGLLSLHERSPNDVYGPKAVVEFDPSSGAMKELFIEDTTIDSLRVSSDGKTLLYALNDGTHQLQMMVRRDGDERELDLDPDGSVIAMSPDGRWVVYRPWSNDVRDGATYAAATEDGHGRPVVEHLAYRGALSSNGVFAYGWDESWLCLTDISDELGDLER